MKALDRFLPEPAVDEVVPLGDQVVDRATAGHAGDEVAGVAERDPAIHAAGALGTEVVFRQVFMKLLPVLDTFGGACIPRQFAFDF